ncbi:MAG TPA: carboxypeptidase regulatory-like domain-containing protein [Myxococcales bacterium]
MAAGTLTGKVTLTGLAPKLANLPVTKDMKSCGTNKPDEALEVGQGNGIKNAVVWFTDVKEPPTERKEKEKLDQENCQYVPHVVVAPVGTTLDVVNSDSVLHNVRASEGATKLFNYAMPIKGHVVPTHLRKEGVFKVSCDVHPWMRAWLLVLPTATYAITDENGQYKVEGVPPGKHKVKIWHERLGEKEQEIEIADDKPAVWDVAYTPR